MWAPWVKCLEMSSAVNYEVIILQEVERCWCCVMLHCDVVLLTISSSQQGADTRNDWTQLHLLTYVSIYQHAYIHVCVHSCIRLLCCFAALQQEVLESWPEYRADIAKLANLNVVQLEQARQKYHTYQPGDDVYKVRWPAWCPRFLYHYLSTCRFTGFLPPRSSPSP